MTSGALRFRGGAPHTVGREAFVVESGFVDRGVERSGQVSEIFFFNLVTLMRAAFSVKPVAIATLLKSI